MSTNDVPGAKIENHDELSIGCWAEHEDGSLIFVESSEDYKVVYSVFDMSKEPPVEYRTATPIEEFKDKFSWDPSSTDSIKWTWHDKTPFPWDKVIKEGAKDGIRYTSAGHLISAAERVAQSQKMIGQPIEEDKYKHLREKIEQAGQLMISGIQTAIDQLKP